MSPPSMPAMWQSIDSVGITHRPSVLISLTNPEDATTVASPLPLHVATGGAPPSPTLLVVSRKPRIEVTRLYGLTETYGLRIRRLLVSPARAGHGSTGARTAVMLALGRCLASAPGG